MSNVRAPHSARSLRHHDAVLLLRDPAVVMLRRGHRRGPPGSISGSGSWSLTLSFVLTLRDSCVSLPLVHRLLDRQLLLHVAPRRHAAAVRTPGEKIIFGLIKYFCSTRGAWSYIVLWEMISSFLGPSKLHKRERKAIGYPDIWALTTIHHHCKSCPWFFPQNATEYRNPGPGICTENIININNALHNAPLITVLLFASRIELL